MPDHAAFEFDLVTGLVPVILVVFLIARYFSSQKQGGGESNCCDCFQFSMEVESNGERQVENNPRVNTNGPTEVITIEPEVKKTEKPGKQEQEANKIEEEGDKAQKPKR
jgi:hypothetical protein